MSSKLLNRPRPAGWRMGWKTSSPTAIVLAGALALAGPIAAAPVASTLPAAADTTLRHLLPNQNFGGDDGLRVGWSKASRSLVRFDQAAIAAKVGTGTLVSAHLEIYVEGTFESLGLVSQEVAAHRVTAAWTEIGATWNCAIDTRPGDIRPDCNPQWSGGSFAATATAKVPHTKNTTGYVRFDVSADVRAFLAGTANQGWLLKKANELALGRIDYASREGASARRPRLALMVEPGGTADTTPPSVAVVSPADGALLANATPTVTATYSDAGTGIDAATARLTVDGVDRTAAATVTATGLSWTPTTALPDGPHTIAVTIADRAGNPASAPSRFTTDVTPPTLAFVEPAAVPVVGTRLPEVAISFYDATAGIGAGTLVLSLDGANLLPSCLVDQVSASCTPPAPLDFGPHQATASVRDGAGNPASAALAFDLADLAPPSIEIREPVAGSYVRTPTVEVACAASDDSAVASVVINGVAATRADDEYRALVPLAEGSNRLTAVATDASGKESRAEIDLFLDTQSPKVTIEAPLAGQPVNLGVVRVAGLATDANPVIAVDANGTPAGQSGSRFEVIVPVGLGAQTVVVHALDAAGNLGSAQVQVTGVDLPQIAITSPADLSTVAATTLDVAGTVSDPTAAVSVNGIAATVSAGAFVAHGVPLIEGGNLISATARTAVGAGAATINVVRDLSPPYLAIAAPVDGAVVYAPSVVVSGLVNDLVAGTVNAAQVAVTVGGVSAEVANRSFLASEVPLAPGDNTLAVEATDASGNRATATLRVRRAAPDTPRIAIVSGDLQAGPIDSLLAGPLAVALYDAAGAPAPGRIVLFQVDGNDGALAGGKRLLAATTDAAGLASTPFTLGKRVGAQRVTASSVGFAGTAVFTATAMPGPPVLVVADDGSLQVGVAGQPLPRPLIATVTDAGFNRRAGIAVRFRVVRGEGSLGSAADAETVVTTDSDGRAIASFTLSPEEGIANNRVEARIDGLDPSPVATFVASGRAAGDPAETSISGIVLDNSNQPVPGVTLRILGTAISAVADEAGRFRVAGAPIGAVKLIVDGSTADRPGSWPDLEFVLSPVPGRDNPLTMPVYLLPLDLAHALPVDETRGGTLRLPEAPGFALEVAPGSVTFPGGSRSGTISVTLVHSDKVPMVPNFGQQPRFIVTIQPAGARFDPPARLTLPNVDALAPGAVTEMYSFDHDLGHFVSIGPATVANDGRTLRSNPGVGVIKAGWHCGGNPDTSGNCEDDECPAGATMCQPDWNVVIDAPTEAQNFDLTTNPTMPRIVARARIQGSPQSPPQLTWSAEMWLEGCRHQPARMDHPPIAGGSGATYEPAISPPLMTGDVRLTVRASADGETKSAERRVVVRGANPSCADVRAEFGHNLYNRKACLESGMRQFRTTPGGFEKCPLFSQDGLGGVGIGQLTVPAPTFADHFNWRTNVSHSISRFGDKATLVDEYPGRLMGGPNPGVPMNPALLTLFQNFNACRFTRGLPPLVSLTIPALAHGNLDDAPGQYERDQLRAYNGLCGPRYLGQRRHQYQLEEDPMCGLVLDVNETTRTASARWVEVDPATRCTGCPRGTRDYVEKVMSMLLPSCGHPAWAAVCTDEGAAAATAGGCE